jgi:hypothetical protein
MTARQNGLSGDCRRSRPSPQSAVPNRSAFSEQYGRSMLAHLKAEGGGSTPPDHVAPLTSEKCCFPAGASPRLAAGTEETMTAEATRSRRPKPLAAEVFQGAISSSRLHLAAEGKSGKTVRTYTEAVQWFAAAHLLRETSHCDWDQVGAHDLQSWMVWLLGRHSDSYASTQYRPFSSSSAGGLTRKSFPTRWPGSIRPGWERSSSRYSPA